MHFISVSAPLTLDSIAGARPKDAEDYTHLPRLTPFEIFIPSICFFNAPPRPAN
jgi:hypothetical protein